MPRPTVLLLLAGLWSATHCVPPQYHLIPSALPWPKARTFCRARHTDLATVFNVEDMNRLVNSAQDAVRGGFAGSAWIGLHDNLTSWRWSLSDSRYYGDKGGDDYRRWDYGQPDDAVGVHACVRMWREGSWGDSPCSLELPFVCLDGTAGTGERFVFVEQESSWSEAQRYCRNFYTDLASVRSEAENKEIEQLANGRSVWIGLYRTHEWSDRSNCSYRNWAPGQPDNVAVKQGCTSANLGNAGLWSVDECSRELGFICYDRGNETGRPGSPTSAGDVQNADDEEDATAATPEEMDQNVEWTSGDPGPDQTGSEEPSTPHVDPTTPFTDESPDHQVWSTTSVTPTEDSSQLFATTRAAPADHVINLRVKLTSENELSEADVAELMSEQVHRLLVETGFSERIKVGLIKVHRPETKRSDDEGPARR